jgi:Family of unknown function (DUF5706)
MRRRRFGRQPKSRQSELVESQPGTPERLPDPDQAWKALSLVNDWIRHAEAKATATLAAAGVTGGVLYNLVQPQNRPSLVLDVIATINALMIIVSGGSAIMALVPRLKVRKSKPINTNTSATSRLQGSGILVTEDPVNLLFFRDIARHYRGDAPTYTQVLSTLTSDPVRLTEHIGQQVHANSDVAHRKYGWANRAAICLALDLIALGITAGIVAHH